MILLIPNVKKEQNKKILKCNCTAKFDHKTLQLTRLHRISNHPEDLFQLPHRFRNNENNPTVTHQLGKEITNEILN